MTESTRFNECIAGGFHYEDEGAGDAYTEFEDDDMDKI